MSWQTELIERYPHLFGEPNQPLQARGYPRVADGWRSVVEKAVARIDGAVGDSVKNAEATVRIIELRQKLGGLRIEVERTHLPVGPGIKLREAIELAQARADTTCEVCGAFGHLYQSANRLITRCDLHAEGDRTSEHDEPEVQIEYEVFDGARRAISSRRYDRELDTFVETDLPFDSD